MPYWKSLPAIGNTADHEDPRGRGSRPGSAKARSLLLLHMQFAATVSLALLLIATLASGARLSASAPPEVDARCVGGCLVGSLTAIFQLKRLKGCAADCHAKAKRDPTFPQSRCSLQCYFDNQSQAVDKHQRCLLENRCIRPVGPDPICPKPRRSYPIGYDESMNQLVGTWTVSLGLSASLDRWPCQMLRIQKVSNDYEDGMISSRDERFMHDILVDTEGSTRDNREISLDEDRFLDAYSDLPTSDDDGNIFVPDVDQYQMTMAFQCGRRKSQEYSFPLTKPDHGSADPQGDFQGRLVFSPMAKSDSSYSVLDLVDDQYALIYYCGLNAFGRESQGAMVLSRADSETERIKVPSMVIQRFDRVLEESGVDVSITEFEENVQDAQCFQQ